MAKVYVSSTIVDLEAERRAVMEWLRAARHQAVDSYLPDSETVRDSCLNDVDGCDLYVLILGHRYGFQLEAENPEKLSITHLEFRRAGQSGIPRIALLRTSVPDIRLTDLLDPQKVDLVRAFEAEVRREVRTAEFSDLQGLIQGLSTGVQSELGRLQTSSEGHRAEAWLAAYLQSVANRFASHMAAYQLESGVHPEELYLDLVITERNFGKREEVDSGNEKESHLLEEVLHQAEAPLVLIGEGGAGKTTSLLYAAARAAERVKGDPGAPIPIYVDLARLTKMEDVPDLLQLIADSVSGVKDWKELSDLEITEHHRILFLFDSFNEIPEQLQRTAAVVLQRFIEKQKDHHRCLIGSRPVPQIEQLARPPSQFKTFEILRLSSDQVRGFLQKLGLGSLYDRMPGELRELAGNPFMLRAIARTLAGAPESTLPRNRGRLYQRFAGGWMDAETKKRRLEYSYERVKEPFLAYLAKLMTSAGGTSLAFSSAFEDEAERQLEETHQRIKRRGGMPSNWTLDACLEEILGDALIKKVNEQLYFIHQSVQEYYTAVYFHQNFPDALVEFTPKILWELVPKYELVEVPNHRFVPALLMMIGLLEDSTKIVEAIAARNPILAAAALSSASSTQSSLIARLEQSWLDLLEHEELRQRVVACSCLALASMRSTRVIKRLVGMAVSSDFDSSYTGILALKRLDAQEIILHELIETTLKLQEGELDEKKHSIGNLMNEFETADVVGTLFERWRVSPANTLDRSRIESLMATVNRSLLVEELQRIRSVASEPAITADAELALALELTWDGFGIPHASRIRQLWARRQKEHTDRVAETVVKMTSTDEGKLADCLRSSDPVSRAAAAKLAAEQRIPVGKHILESLLLVEQGWSENELISALVSLWGGRVAVSRLVEASRQQRRRISDLNPDLTPQVKSHDLSNAFKEELKKIGVDRELSVTRHEIDGAISTWSLSPSSWSGYHRPIYQLVASPGRLELYDCNGPARAFETLSQIPGDAAFVELQRAVEHENPTVQRIAVNALVERGGQDLAPRLLALLRSSTSGDFIDAALSALRELRAPEATTLVNDLLFMTEGEYSDLHPVWGHCTHTPGWADLIHSIWLFADLCG